MALLGVRQSTVLQASLLSKGMIGISLLDFCLAIGNGCVSSLVGKTFTTQDTGAVSGAGAGIGVALTQVSAPAVSNMIYAAAVTKFQTLGQNLKDICDAVAESLVTELSQATLTSTHSPVYAGVGTVVPGSIPVNDAEWSSNIQSFGPTMRGDSWPDFSDAIAQGCVMGMKTATGQVIISGSGSGGSGSGTGQGIIT